MIEYFVVLFLLGKDPINIDNVKYKTEQECWTKGTLLVMALSPALDFDSPSFTCKRIDG